MFKHEKSVSDNIHFEIFFPKKSTKKDPAVLKPPGPLQNFLFISPDDSPLERSYGEKFDRYFISRENTDEVHTELTADMGKYHMFVFQFYFKHRVRQFLQNSAFYFDHICFLTFFLPPMS